MKYYLLASEPKGAVDPADELKFFEWLKYLKKNNRVTNYWAFQNKPGLAAILRLNFESDLDELLESWNKRIPSSFDVDALKDPKLLETDLAAKLLG